MVVIRISFNVGHLQFQCEFEEIAADKVEEHITSTICGQTATCLSVLGKLSNISHVRYNTAVRLDHHDIKEEIKSSFFLRKLG